MAKTIHNPIKPRPRPALRCSPADLRMYVGLRPQQAVVVSMLIEGQAAKQVGYATQRSQQAVCIMRRAVLRHTGCANMLELVASGVREGWITFVEKEKQNE